MTTQNSQTTATLAILLRSPRRATLALCGALLGLTVAGCEDPDASQPRPVLTMKKIGEPVWMPADFHRFSGDIGEGYSRLGDPLLALLGAEQHSPHPNLGIGPGAAHSGPYDRELAAGMMAQGWSEQSVFAADEMTLPLAAVEVWMLVPSADAPTGSSPDFAAGPILPNAIFPIHVDLQVYLDEVKVDGDVAVFDVPPLDAALAPPFDVDGHSHVPIIIADDIDSLPQRSGEHEYRGTLLDAAGHGWEVSMRYAIE